MTTFRHHPEHHSYCFGEQFYLVNSKVFEEIVPHKQLDSLYILTLHIDVLNKGLIMLIPTPEFGSQHSPVVALSTVLIVIKECVVESVSSSHDGHLAWSVCPSDEEVVDCPDFRQVYFQYDYICLFVVARAAPVLSASLEHIGGWVLVVGVTFVLAIPSCEH